MNLRFLFWLILVQGKHGEKLKKFFKERTMKNVGFISTRFSGTDGVTLETKKWAKVLERNGFKTFYLAGELDTPSCVSMLSPKMSFFHSEIVDVQRECFGKKTRKRSATKKINRLKEEIKEWIYKFVEKFSIDIIVPENSITIPMNIPLGVAIAEFIEETGLPAVAHHHDFFWERDRFLINSCSDYLAMAFPPLSDKICNVVINTPALKNLTYRKGVSAIVVPNVYDFETPPPPPDEYALSLRKILGFDDDDLFILQPTRVVPRKQIEKAIDLVALMNLKKPALVISHSKGDEGDDYFERIKLYADKVGVELLFIDDMVSKERKEEGGKRYFTLWDVYQNADLITYPSSYEGFGNAFLEAIYFKKMVVVNRYSIYIADIEPLGFEVVNFENFVTSSIVEKVFSYIKDKKRLKEAVEKNYELARKYFSFSVLEDKIIPIFKRL